MFDPEKVDRLYRSIDGDMLIAPDYDLTAPAYRYVRAADYDRLLKLYEEVVECFKEVSGKYNWLRGKDSE